MPSKFGQGVEELEAGSKGVAFAKTYYFGIEDKESAVVRFMTDANYNPANPHLEGWINVLQHNGVPTCPKPDWQEADRSWPPRFGVVCRHTKCKALPGEPELWSVMEDKEYDECYVCDRMRQKDGKPWRASTRGWALGCLREEVREDGRLVGFRDQTREIEIDGKKVNELAIVIFNLGWKNFFSTLAGYASHYGTAVDRDYKITRAGENLDTQYQIIPMDPVPGFDLRDPKVFEHYATKLTLDDEIDSRARWDWHRRWFDPTFTPPKRNEEEAPSSGDGAPVVQQGKPDTEMAGESLDDMAARVTNRYSPPAPSNGDAAPAGLRNIP